MAKGLRKSIARSTDTRAGKKLERVFVDLSGKMAVPSIGRKRYTLTVRDEYTRFTRVYFLAKTSDAASAFESFLAEVRADGTPSAVMCVRSDSGGNVFGGEHGTLCRKRGIKEEFTPADSPKYNGVAERALALINDTALAARIQARVLYPGAPSYPSLWAKSVSWARNALIRTATKVNPGTKSPYEMEYGSPPFAGQVWPFLKPTIYRVKRENNSQLEAQDCSYVVPSVNHPPDCIRVLTTHRTILTIRNATWQHIPPAPPAPQQHLPPIVEKGESTAGEGASGEGASSQGGARVEDLDSESDLGMTGVGPVLPATRKAPVVEAGAGTGGVVEGNSPALSTPSRRAKIGSVNDSSNSMDNSTSRRGSDSSTSHTSNGSSRTSGSGSSGDIPALTGTEARRLQHFGKPPELQSGRTRSQPRGWTLSESFTDALLAYARTEAKEAEETERAHDLLLEERLGGET